MKFTDNEWTFKLKFIQIGTLNLKSFKQWSFFSGEIQIEHGHFNPPVN